NKDQETSAHKYSQNVPSRCADQSSIPSKRSYDRSKRSKLPVVTQPEAGYIFSMRKFSEKERNRWNCCKCKVGFNELLFMIEPDGNNSSAPSFSDSIPPFRREPLFNVTLEPEKVTQSYTPKILSTPNEFGNDSNSPIYHVSISLKGKQSLGTSSLCKIVLLRAGTMNSSWSFMYIFLQCLPEVSNELEEG
ncbi:hypothetical protein L345_08069, partial [Ophiophagus hannah]